MDRSAVPCGPFAVLRATNSREHARTAVHEPQCFRGISRLFTAVRTSNENRGEGYRLAFQCGFPAFCGPFAVLGQVRFRRSSRSPTLDRSDVIRDARTVGEWTQ